MYARIASASALLVPVLDIRNEYFRSSSYMIGSFWAITCSGLEITSTSQSWARLDVTSFRSGPTQSPPPMVWQTEHLCWKMALACAEA